MAACIIDRGRGAEVAGPRVTVYRVMDFLHEGSSAGRIATELHLTEEQVHMALDYIAMHRRTVEAEYEKILQRSKHYAAQVDSSFRAGEREIPGDELVVGTPLILISVWHHLIEQG